MTNIVLDFWDSFVYFVFPIVDDNGNNYFDEVQDHPELGLTFVNMAVDSTATVDEESDEFTFQQVASTYTFEITFDYSSGIMKQGSVQTDEGDNVVINRAEISSVGLVDFPQSLLLASILILPVLRYRKW